MSGNIPGSCRSPKALNLGMAGRRRLERGDIKARALRTVTSDRGYWGKLMQLLGRNCRAQQRRADARSTTGGESGGISKPVTSAPHK